MNITDNSGPGFLIALVWCVVGIVGCGVAKEPHEDEHFEHFVPAHKPKDFEHLVEQLALRIPQMAAASTGGDDDHATALQERSDIIGWIPELAADSDLIKADFEAAIANGHKLAALSAANFRRTKPDAAEVAEFARVIEELQDLVLKSQMPKEPM